MGRKSEYVIKKGETLEEQRERIKKIGEKIGEERLTVQEVADYLSSAESYSLSDRTIKNYINTLCKITDGIRKEDFMENGCYVIPPEIHGEFFCLIQSHFFSNHKNALGRQKKINAELIENIGDSDNILSEEDKRKLQSRFPYLNARLESGLIEQYFLAWYLLNKTLFQMNGGHRYRAVKTIIKTISKMQHTLELSRIRMEIDIDKVGRVIPELKAAELFGDELSKALISQMADKLREKDWSKSENDELNAIIDRMLIGLKTGKEDEIRKVERDIEQILLPRERYEELEKKIDSVFDLEDATEKEIAELIKQVFDDIYSISKLKACLESDSEIRNIKENMYTNFFREFRSVSQYLEVVNSDEYKDYLKIKDSKEYKEFLASKKNI